MTCPTLWEMSTLDYHIMGVPSLFDILMEMPYFMGGYTGSAYTNAVKKLNPDTNTSSAAASMNTPRAYHAATVVGNQIIVCGGEIYCSKVMKIVGYNSVSGYL